MCTCLIFVLRSFDLHSVTALNSVRFKIVWVYWCWCYTRSALWFTVCHRNGMGWPMYVSSFFPPLHLPNSPCLCFLTMEFVHLDLLLVSALLLEFAAQSSVGINKDVSQHPEEMSPLRFYFFVFSLLHILLTHFYSLFLILILFWHVSVDISVSSSAFISFSFF